MTHVGPPSKPQYKKNAAAPLSDTNPPRMLNRSPPQVYLYNSIFFLSLTLINLRTPSRIYSARTHRAKNNKNLFSRVRFDCSSSSSGARIHNVPFAESMIGALPSIASTSHKALIRRQWTNRLIRRLKSNDRETEKEWEFARAYIYIYICCALSLNSTRARRERANERR